MPREFFVIAHNVRSCHNVGAIFRTGDAFGVTKIFLTGYTPTPGEPKHREKIAKVALGAETWVPWERCKTAAGVIKILKDSGVRTVGLELAQSAVPLGRFRPKFSLALLLGEEVRGISPSLRAKCDSMVSIPMFGKKESLNVSVAFGIAAYAIRQKI